MLDRTVAEKSWKSLESKSHKESCGFREALPAKDSGQTIKQKHFIPDYVNLHNDQLFGGSLVSTPWNKAESLHLQHDSLILTLIVSLS